MDAKARETFLTLLRGRFEKHPERHRDMGWADIKARLEADPGKIDTLKKMEDSGGEPDVIGLDGVTGEILYCDCSPESPTGRRSLCYDRPGLESRKEHKPAGSAVEAAQDMGIELLDEDGYRTLQRIGDFDLKTSSWILTPPAIRKLGGALFCDRRYDTVFVYHNGADSYYAARGFRGLARIG
jgi:hypothetical protein